MLSSSFLVVTVVPLCFRLSHAVDGRHALRRRHPVVPPRPPVHLQRCARYQCVADDTLSTNRAVRSCAHGGVDHLVDARRCLSSVAMPRATSVWPTPRTRVCTEHTTEELVAHSSRQRTLDGAAACAACVHGRGVGRSSLAARSPVVLARARCPPAPPEPLQPHGRCSVHSK